MCGNCPLGIAVFLNRFRDHQITPLFVFQNPLRKDLVQPRPVRKPLAPRYLRHISVSFEMIDHLLRKFLLTQDCLTSDFRPYRLPDPPRNKLLIVFLCLCPFSAKLSQDPISGKTRMTSFLSCRGPVAAPFPCCRRFQHPCPHGIQHYVSAYFEQMTVFLNKDRLIPALKQMTGSSVEFIEELGIHPI